jgi:hypothetical protein
MPYRTPATPAPPPPKLTWLGRLLCRLNGCPERSMSAPRTVSRIPWSPDRRWFVSEPLPVTIVVFKRTCGRCGRIDQDLRLEES